MTVNEEYSEYNEEKFLLLYKDYINSKLNLYSFIQIIKKMNYKLVHDCLMVLSNVELCATFSKIKFIKLISFLVYYTDIIPKEYSISYLIQKSITSPRDIIHYINIWNDITMSKEDIHEEILIAIKNSISRFQTEELLLSMLMDDSLPIFKSFFKKYNIPSTIYHHQHIIDMIINDDDIDNTKIVLKLLHNY
jgi:hypothetical protein